MELAPFDPIDFKKFTDGKTIVKVSKCPSNNIQSIAPSTNNSFWYFWSQDTDMDPLVENEAKLHITNGIEKASGATGVDIKVSAPSNDDSLTSIEKL